MGVFLLKSVILFVPLLIKSELAEPPSENLPFRDVTMASKCDLGLDVLIECKQDLKDAYFYFMKPRGMLDYVDYLITPEENEEGDDAANQGPEGYVVGMYGSCLLYTSPSPRDS